MLRFDDGFLNPTPTDFAHKDTARLSTADVRELQDAHNVNNCDECDGWLDADPQSAAELTIIDELEFWERYGD